MSKQTWQQWIRACSKDPGSPICLPPGGLAMLTGQDTRALGAISACWELYACSDRVGQNNALLAIGALVRAMQPQCRPFARELIAFSLDWSDRDRLWPLVDA